MKLMEFFFYYYLSFFPEDANRSSLHGKDPKPATPSGGPSVPQTPPGPRPIAEPAQEPLVGLSPKLESGHHSLPETRPATEPAAEPAEKSGRSPGLKVNALFPVWVHNLLLRLDSFPCRHNRNCPGRTSLVWFLCLHSEHFAQPTAPPT